MRPATLKSPAERGSNCISSHTTGGAASLEPLHILAGRGLIALRRLRRAEARLVMTEAGQLAEMQKVRQHQSCGFASFTDFAREALQMSPRTANRRLALHRTLEQSPLLASAFAHARLSSCKVICLRPVAQSDSLPFWIELAQTVSVRELGRRIKEATQAESETLPAEPDAAPPAADDQDEAGGTVTFAAPFSAAAAWDEALATARRVLGWEAPPHLCIEAILSEAEAALPASLKEKAGAETTKVVVESDLPSSRRPRTHHEAKTTITRNAPRNPEKEGCLVRTLRFVDRELDSLEALLNEEIQQPGETARAQNNVARIKSLHDLHRPLRVLQARLLRVLHAAGALSALGHDTLAHFVESELGLSERTGQRLIAEAFLFDDNHELTRAFETGRIGLGQAFLINRVALSRTRSAFIRRAHEVTHLQFAREIHFLEKLAEYAPTIWAEDRGPLPQPRLEAALRDALHEAGVSRDEIQEELRSLGVEAEAGHDPAAHPSLMRRLEVLLELLVLARERHDSEVESDHSECAGSTSAAGTRHPPTLALGTRRTTITFWAPDSILAQWNHALARVRARWGPIPTWAGATLIVEHVVREWNRIDPTRRPSETPILERDDYRCQAPGCSARRRLEVHHVVFRSQGGSDADGNKVTLCHAHHHHGIHDGTIQLQGAAPDKLTWEMGCLEGRQAFMTLQGARILNHSGERHSSMVN